MSDLSTPWMTVPTGRRLDVPGRKNQFGSIGPFQSADPERVQQARRYLDQVDADQLDRSNRRVWTNRETGDVPPGALARGLRSAV